MRLWIIEFSESILRLIGMGRLSELPRYSAETAAAFTVVAAMSEKGFHFLLMVSHESGLAIASFYLGPHDRTDNSATEEHDKIPRAICRAALRALETTTT